jgi:hypothetical protein
MEITKNQLRRIIKESMQEHVYVRAPDVIDTMGGPSWRMIRGLEEDYRGIYALAINLDGPRTVVVRDDILDSFQFRIGNKSATWDQVKQAFGL